MDELLTNGNLAVNTLTHAPHAEPNKISVHSKHCRVQKTIYTNFYRHRNSSVSIALGYRLKDQGSRVRFPAGAGNFSLHHGVQNGSGSHPASYPMCTRGSYPGCESGRGVKLTTHLHLVPRSKLQHRDNFTLYCPRVTAADTHWMGARNLKVFYVEIY
jgi:hypothetical protein